MDQPIIIKYKWTVDDLLQAHRCHFRHTCRPVFRFGLHSIFALILLGGTLGIFRNTKGSPAIAIAFIIVGVYWFAIRPFERRWMIRRQYAKRPDKDIDCEWEVRSDKIATRSCVGRAEFSWEAIIKVVRAPSGIMLYSLEEFFHWLPRRGFESDAEFERLSDLAKSKVQRFYRVS